MVAKSIPVLWSCRFDIWPSCCNVTTLGRSFTHDMQQHNGTVQCSGDVLSLGRCHISYHIISYHILDLKRQNLLKVGINKPKLKVKLQSVSVSNDNVRKRLLEKPRFELVAKGVFSLQGR